jgi:hypothetical protein
MKIKRIPHIGFYLLIASLVCLIVAYILSIATFNAFSYDVNKFVLVLPIFASIIIILEIAMSFIDKDKPFWTRGIDLLFSVFVIFAFANLLIPFLTPIGIYFTVNMGDTETYAIAIPRCIAGCIFYVVSAIIFVASSFFNIVKIKEAN